MNAVAVSLASERDEPANDLFARIGAFLVAHRLSADPANYAFAHAAISDPDSDVARAAARVAAEGCRLSGSEIERLGGHAATGAPVVALVRPLATAPVTEDPASIAVDGLLARAQTQIDGFARTMRSMHTDTREFGDDLVAAIDGASALSAIDEVARLTNTMIERVRQAEIRLEAATREADELRSALDEAQNSARRDPLTDLPNRRAFDEAFVAIPPGTPVAIGICDIDRFKAVNDEFGHGVGDRVLKAIGRAIAADCGDCLVARHGGEEFVVLITGATDEAAAMLDRSRERIAGKRFRMRESDALVGRITFSAGLATMRADETLDALMARADAALYRAKADGRNCLRIAPDDGN